MNERLPPTHEPWLSRRHWRRLVEAYAAGRITRAELSALKRRLARVRTRSASRPPPVLRLVPGGGGPGIAAPAPVPFSPNPLEAA
ncbi:hypothetical protein [Anaeromyxobacter oryzae]|uniref:DUF1707 domain-containing protein n=1 Tax=Anaeromyxobacter oryzae TaxID=2918170 RepID=A0ABM7X4Z6_9BACT|nr:hypothetical protein [Anaeromyxobacter oryzae]BDG06883.1 hypothetical protein AMOR_58790 [Anaeromyxobacter oryzae]